MLPVATDVACSMVHVFCTNVSCGKVAKPLKPVVMPLEQTHMGPRNHILAGGPSLTLEGALMRT